MTIYVALLYSIILRQGPRLVMADLRDMAEALGLQSPRTLLATGNLIFEAPGATATQLETGLEAAFEARFGKHVDIIVRRAEDWRRVVAANPFPAESEVDASNVIIRVMRDRLGDGHLAALQPYCQHGERLALVNGDLWIHFPKEPALSRLLPQLTPKRLGIGTMRAWSTVKRIGEALG